MRRIIARGQNAVLCRDGNDDWCASATCCGGLALARNPGAGERGEPGLLWRWHPGLRRFPQTLHIAGNWRLPLLLVCENNGWEMASSWDNLRKHRSLIPYAEPFGFAARSVDGNDPLDVYHSTRWARETALVGQPVFLDCMTFRIGTYSSHFGETRPDIEREMEKWKARDPIVRMAEWLTSHDLASAGELERFGREEQERIESAFQQVLQEVKQ